MLVWKYEFLCCCLGCLSKEGLQEVTRDIDEISNMRGRQNCWAIRSKAFCGLLRHNQRLRLGWYVDASPGQIQDSDVRPFDWVSMKFFSFLMANSKGYLDPGPSSLKLLNPKP